MEWFTRVQINKEDKWDLWTSVSVFIPLSVRSWFSLHSIPLGTFKPYFHFLIPISLNILGKQVLSNLWDQKQIFSNDLEGTGSGKARGTNLSKNEEELKK